MGWFDFVTGNKDSAPEWSQTAAAQQLAEQQLRNRKGFESDLQKMSIHDRKGKAKTDSNIMDEAAGRARVTLRSESKVRKKAEEDDLRKKNAERKARLTKKETDTDTDIMDEEAGRARLMLASKSKVRRQREAEEEKRRTRAMKKALKGQDAITDSDITDEEAGRARVRLANESRRRRLQERQKIAKENKELRDKLRATKARTDNDITDDDIGGLGGAGVRAKKATMSSLQNQWRPGSTSIPQQFRWDYRHNGHGTGFAQHVTDYERGVAGRGEREFAEFPWDDWVTRDHSPEAERQKSMKDTTPFGVPPPVLEAPPTNRRIPPVPHSKKYYDWGNPPPPCERTHTKRFVESYIHHVVRRQQQMSKTKSLTVKV